MKELRSTHFQPCHIDYLEPMPHDRAFLGDPFIREALYSLSMGGPSVTLYEDDPEPSIVCCMGVRLAWNGYAMAWLFASPKVPEYAKRVYKTAKIALRSAETFYHLHRIDTTVREDFEVGHEFIKRLGFEDEGLRKRLGPDGADYRQYVRLTV